MRHLLICTWLLLGAFGARAESNNYRLSVTALIAAHAADTASSWQRWEANPLLGERFGGQALAVKSGIVGAVLVGEWLMCRHHPDRKRWFAWINYGGATAAGMVAVRNYRTER